MGSELRILVALVKPPAQAPHKTVEEQFRWPQNADTKIEWLIRSQCERAMATQTNARKVCRQGHLHCDQGIQWREKYDVQVEEDDALVAFQHQQTRLRDRAEEHITLFSRTLQQPAASRVCRPPHSPSHILPRASCNVRLCIECGGRADV